MENIKNEYKKIVEERKIVLKELKELKENELIKKYLELNNKENTLLEKEEELYKELKEREYSSCNHMWVTTRYERDSFEGRSESYCGCIKCGLNQDVLRKNREWLSLNEQIMYKFMQVLGYYGYMHGTIINESCDLDLARAIYSKIKEAHPDIDDQTAKKYFEISLNDIRNIKVSESRTINRAKRLALKPNFDKWTSRDIRF